MAAATGGAGPRRRFGPECAVRPHRYPYLEASVLDRSRVRAGHSHAEALRDAVTFARQAETLGYHRFRVSEHHDVPDVAGSTPTVLATAVAAATTTIRVDTGGVMLPDHQPLVVAEQFGVLDSVFSSQIDMLDSYRLPADLCL